MKKFKFLIMEDNEEYYLALRMKADSLRKDRKYPEVEFLYAKDFPSAKELYNRHGYTIQGIILDVVNYKVENQSMPDESCLPVARDYFKEKAEHLPIVALTGQPGMYEMIKKAWAGSIEVFSKSDDEEKMLDYLIREVKKLADSKILKRHSDVFEGTDKYLGTDAFGRLLACVRNMENSDITTITGTLSNLRKLQEYFYLALNKIDNNMVPKALIYSDRTKIDNEKIIRHLKGNYDPATRTTTTLEYVKHNSKADRLLNYVYKGCSEEIHVTDQNTTKYMTQSLVFAFMDLVLWLKDTAEPKK
jgi:FixJ family two-component response regulator